MPFISTFEEIGFENGMQRGLSQGLTQGLTQSRIEDIETILEARFPDAGAQLMPEIRLINDAEQLRKILRAAATVASPEELRKLWADGPAG